MRGAEAGQLRPLSSSSASSVTGSDEGSEMGWRHYIAFVIAVFQTVLFPLVVFIIVLVVLTIILSRHL